jgi:LDH2 family malate/lactate/ureidoglycolate dehydrogenase
VSAPSSAADDPLVSWSDVVFTLRDSAQDRIVLGAADLAVYAGETLCIAAPDDVTRRAVVDLLTGRTRPRYGVIKGTGQLAARASGNAICVLVRRDGQAATIVVAEDASAAPQATRVLSVVRGGFQPSAGTTRGWPAEAVRAAVSDQLKAAGAPAPTAALVADVLVDADVRGHHSHGVELLPMYLDRVRHGGIDPLATPSWVTRGTVVRVLSGNGGFGQLAARQAAVVCAQAAAEHGIAAVAVRDNNHVGMLAAYRQPFADAGIVALILNISGPSVAAPGAGKACLGNNAVCLIASGDSTRAPLIADFATGAVASGKIRDIGTRGGRVPDGWLLGPDGQPSLDPADLDRGGSVPVFGGSATGYKGLCVAVITEVLAGMLAGATISPRVNKQRQHPELAMGCSQLFIGFSPGAFLAGDITELTTALMNAVAGAYGQAGPPAVYFPEQLEQLRTKESAEQGIRVPGAVAAQLGLVAG